MEQVVPGSIVYSDLKPEAIMNDVRLVKYYPTSNVNGQLPQDIVRFELRGNGFFDPYSAYVYFEVQVDTPSAPANVDEVSAQLLDDSAHSLIQRLVIRSEGSELERLENYDVLAKMLNDITYTDEMRKAHNIQGFGVNQIQQNSLYHSGYSIYEPGYNTSGVKAIRNDIGKYITKAGAHTGGITNGPKQVGRVVNGEYQFLTAAGTEQTVTEPPASSSNSNILRFCIPLYSGILGLLMPEKKMIPLSYMPLEVEFTLNPYAFYSVGGADTRSYTISKMEIHSHVVTFEHEVARQLDAVVARQGLYIPYESFFQSATTVSSATASDTSITIPVNAHFKSITSLHMVMLPGGYETSNTRKKLQFVSGNLKSLQVRNGINYMPSLPITGAAGSTHNGNYALFYLEMLKSWNKLHDSATPVPISPLQFCSNRFVPTSAGKSLESTTTEQSLYPASQFGISFQGETLGMDMGTITGKRGLTPFNIECQFTMPKGFSGGDVTGAVIANQQLYFIPYVRADFLLYIRPDLVVQVLGK